MASPRPDKPADLELLNEAMGLAKRPQEKRLVLGVLGSTGVPGALAALTPALDDPDLAEEAGLAAVIVVESLGDREKDQARAAMEKVVQCVKNEQTHDRAKTVLESL